MTDAVAQSSEESAEENAAASNDNLNPDEINKKLDKLYDRIPKFLAHLVKDNAERYNSLDALLNTFSTINRLESDLAQGSGSPISLLSIYGMASSGGGGSSEDLEALQDANNAFAEENKILAETIQTLTFQLKRTKNESADEIINAENLKTATFRDLRNASGNIQNILGDIEKRLWFIREENTEQKPLDERFLEDLGNFDDITASMLRASPESATFAGRILRRAGFSYDHKDLATVRRIVACVLKINREMANFGGTLDLIREQLEKLNEIAGLLEVAAGHEERQDPQYKEAMEEIDRLNGIVDRYKELNGEIKDLEKQTEELEKQIEEKEKEAAQLHGLKIKVREMRETLAKLEEESESLRKPGQKSGKSEKYDEDGEEEFFGFEEEYDEEGEQRRDLEIEIESLKSQLRVREAELQAQINSLEEKQRLIEGGLLVEKLEQEIGTLRGMARRSDEEAERQKLLREAFEKRVTIWVKDGEKLQEQAATWRKRALVKGAKIAFAIAAAGGLGAAAGYQVQSFFSDHASVPLVWIQGIGVPAFLGALCRFWYERDEGSDFEDSFKGAGLGAIKFGLAGLLTTALVFTPMSSYYRGDVEKSLKGEHDEKLMHACEGAPCRLVRTADGRIVPVKLSEAEAKELFEKQAQALQNNPDPAPLPE